MESIDDFCFCNLGSSSTLTRKRLVGVPEKRVEASAESHRSDGRRRMETWPEPCQITTTFRPLYLYLPLSLLILILVFVCIKESGGCSTSLTSEEARRVVSQRWCKAWSPQRWCKVVWWQSRLWWCSGENTTFRVDGEEDDVGSLRRLFFRFRVFRFDLVM